MGVDAHYPVFVSIDVCLNNHIRLELDQDKNLLRKTQLTVSPFGCSCHLETGPKYPKVVYEQVTVNIHRYVKFEKSHEVSRNRIKTSSPVQEVINFKSTSILLIPRHKVG